MPDCHILRSQNYPITKLRNYQFSLRPLRPLRLTFSAMSKQFKGTQREVRALNAYVKLARASNTAIGYGRIDVIEHASR